MQNKPATRIVILGTGGTIAGTAADPDDHVGYTAAQLGIDTLVAAVPALAGLDLESEQVAQLDSKDMDFATWQRLARRVAHHLARDEVGGVVVTHGTDTMEETAYFLQRVLAPAKPVVLTGAMRPATARDADGPRNLADAVTLARDGRVVGVSVVMAGRAWAAAEVRKRHTRSLQAFDAGAAEPLALIEPGQATSVRASTPASLPGLGLACLETEVATWPRVEIVLNHAGADGRSVDLMSGHGVAGWIAAGTGNGNLSRPLESALRRAAQSGQRVWRCSRCADGEVVGADDAEIRISPLASAVQARVEMLLRMLCERSDSSTR